MADLSRDEYAGRYGPTTDDRLRLGDTDLWVRVEDDHVGFGDEPIWGYAKNFRSRMAQFDRATAESELDMLIAGVVVIDPLLGVVKTNIGIKDGRIAGIGRAGSPDITDGVELVIGPNTWPVNGYGLIATAGAVDSHVHLITPRLVPVALSAGVTTLISAGFEEPAYTMDKTYRAFEELPVNLGLQASARTDAPGQIERVIEAGACGLKIHEDWGAYPEIVDAALGQADAHDVAVCLHTDGLNESCELEDTVDAIGGRAVHAYHVEGAGGGHVPDVIGLVREPNVVCSSTTPTIPYGRGPGADPSRDHGGRRPPARSRSHLDREQRLAGDGPDRRDDPPHVAAGPRDEGMGGGERRQRQRQGPAVHREVHDRAGSHPWHRARGRLPYAGPSRRSRALAPEPLRREAGAGGEGRCHRLGGHGRCQRVDPNPPARSQPTDVRGVRACHWVDGGDVCLGGGAGVRGAGAARAAASRPGGGALPQHR